MEELIVEILERVFKNFLLESLISIVVNLLIVIILMQGMKCEVFSFQAPKVWSVFESRKRNLIGWTLVGGNVSAWREECENG